VFALIWWVYSTNTQIEGGRWTKQEAIFWTFQMAIVSAMLASIALLLSSYLFSPLKTMQGLLADFFMVGVTLAGYTGVNVWWRNSWNGDLSKPAFLPLWNDVNAHFFYEWNWLNYLLFLSPLVAIFSAFLSHFLFRNRRSTQQTLDTSFAA
jgi:hypothetical protein